MTKSRVIDRDFGFKQMMKDLDAINGTHVVEVGFPETSKAYKDGPNQVLVASANEFGTDTIPERSFLRSTFDEQAQEFAAFLSRQIGYVVDNKITIGQALDRLGLKAVAEVQKKIVALDDPPNAEYTIKMKKSSNPLIDTGQMRQSVTHRVRKEK